MRMPKSTSQRIEGVTFINLHERFERQAKARTSLVIGRVEMDPEGLLLPSETGTTATYDSEDGVLLPHRAPWGAKRTSMLKRILTLTLKVDQHCKPTSRRFTVLVR